ncbi:acyl carrier protein 1, chloroplastic-like [Curcuma longa]|uniref:acyl carrier protein 1, chloroplastic-like n=1 Tax=Curcuma longa TaxID=136217 RepID=UPI003D9F4F80
MASVAGTVFTVSVRPPRQLLQVSNHLSGLKSVSFTSQRKSFVSICSAPRFLVSCAAKPETLEKVCSIVKKQLALAENALVTGESTFVQLGADSLDTVEVVMGLEEEFGISVEEENAQTIQTVQDAADMIEILLEKKNAA